MIRIALMVAGVGFTLLGSIALFLFGIALVDLPLHLVQQAGEAHQAFNSYRLSAAASVLMALGATLIGFVAQRDSVRLSSSGKATVALAGLLTALAALAILYGLFLEYRLVSDMLLVLSFANLREADSS